MASRSALIEGGIGQVKVLLLARTLGVSTGSFYWHFRDLPTLHDELIVDWQRNNTRPLLAAVAANPGSGVRQFEAVMDVWVAETEYSPAWDSAMREWARSNPKVESAVRRVDAKRIALLQGTFRRMGYAVGEALIRARITYYHQVGYYSLGIVERKADRLRVKPRYNAVFMGEKGRAVA